MVEVVTAADQQVVIEIGNMPVLVRTDSAEFLRMLEDRYSGFLGGDGHPACEFDVELVPPGRLRTKTTSRYGSTPVGG